MDRERFKQARPGDMLCASFQCDHCWFVNLQGREPQGVNSVADTMLMPYIRRVNLDILWSRETSTVYGNYLVTVKKKTLSAEMNLPIQFEPRGPWPVADRQGFQTAVEMVKQSRLQGKNDKTYQQFDSIRKFRSASTNEFESGLEAADELMLVGDGGRSFRVSAVPTQSRLFVKFMRGCEKRMGRLVKQNKALDVRILLKMLHAYELELISKKTSVARKRFVKMASAYFVISFVGALRGGEGLMLEATSLASYSEEGRMNKVPYVLAPLLGRFKGETGERNVLLPFAAVTKSGIQVRLILDRVLAILVKEGRSTGALSPAICHVGGKSISRTELNKEFITALEKIQEDHHYLIAKNIDVGGTYNIYRSLRRGATSRATVVGLGTPEIEKNNRWRKFQNKSGTMPRLKMHDLYTDIKLALNSYLLFSSAL